MSAERRDLVDLPSSPSTGGRPTTIHYRERGRGAPLLLLHGGWGYGYYPFDDAMDALADRFRCIAPDRSGFGRSTPVADVSADFHARAASEMRAFLDALGIHRAALWGHSDGAVVAAAMAAAEPGRYEAIVLEAHHHFRVKPRSRAFFEAMAERPEEFGARVVDALAAEHGARWRDLVRMNGRAWLRLADEAATPEEPTTAYANGARAPPTLLLHGGRDPRTEPGEVEAMRRSMPRARLHLVDAGGHCPHAEPGVAKGAIAAAREFLADAAR